MILKSKRTLLVAYCERQFSVSGQTRIVPVKPEDRMMHILPAKISYNQQR